MQDARDEDKRYSVIYADPPWKFGTYSNKGKGRSAEAWYDCLDIKDIKAFPVLPYAADDCVLLMWVTDPFLQIGFDVIKDWGFTYKTVGIYWVKENPGPVYPIGTGYWTRANPELCLLATRGRPKRVDAGVPKLLLAPRREHSRKPDEAYERIMRLCRGPYLELFARQQWPGWDCLGNQSETGPTLRRRWGASEGMPELCEDCHTYPADPPSLLCPGCQAFKEHQQ